MQYAVRNRWVAIGAVFCALSAGVSLFAAEPEQVLRDRQLVRVGSYVVVAEETDVLAGTHNLRISNGRQASDERTRHDLELAVQKALTAFDALSDRLEAADARRKTDRSQAAAVAYNAVLGDYGRQQHLLEDQARHYKTLRDARASYVDLGLDLMDRAALANAHYEEVVQDPAVKAAIAELNQNAVHPFKLGPSPAFTEAVQFILACRDGLIWDTVPIVMDGTVPEVSVIVNGAPPVTMIWDSGASYLTLSAATAAQLGLHATPEDPTITTVTADGGKVRSKKIYVQSVRVGGVTVENVECIIHPAGTNSPSLLGGAFQRRCVYRLDVPGKQILLTRLDPPEAAYKATRHALLPVASHRRFAAVPQQPATPHITVLKRSPDEVFKEKQLARMGLLLTSAEEAEVRTMVNAVRDARKKVDSEAIFRRGYERDYNWALTSFRDLEAKARRLNLQVTRASTAAERRQAAVAHDAVLVQIKQVQTKQDELLKKMYALSDTRLVFLGLVLEAQEKIAGAAAHYSALASDDEVNLAIAKINAESPGNHLGPSGAFLSDSRFIADFKVDPNSGIVPILVRGSTAEVDVMLNEKARVRMTWDSGATSILLSTAMAAQAGVYPTDRDRTVLSELADGRHVATKVTTLASVRVGAMKVQNVECLILPPEVQIDEGLLGISFQQHFNCRLDLQAGQLQLTRINTPDRQPDTTAQPVAQPPAIPTGPVAITPAPAAPAPALPTPAQLPKRAGAGSVLLMVGNPKEEGVFSAARGTAHVVKPADSARALADPQTYSASNVIVFGRNTIVDVPEGVMTAAWQNIREFMEKGGDVVLFEQTAGNPELERRLSANYQFLELNFRVQIHRQTRNGAMPEPLLAAQTQGLGAEMIGKIHFYNWYTLPDEATVLLRAGPQHDVVAGALPVGKGRLILIGTNLDPADEPLDRVVLQALYSGK